jgi:diguanylate cyclase (GGDEF)-like protein
MLPGAAVGLTGLVIGTASVIVDLPLLGFVAGVCALSAGLVAVMQTLRVHEAEMEAATAVDAVTLRHLELFTSARERSLVDEATGLPDHRFFELALEGRVASARRHLWPLTLVLVELEIETLPGDEHAAAEALASFSVLLRRTLREADIACRLTGTRFAMILEDTAEEGAVWTAERLQIGLARNTGHISRLSAGVASYPTHALQAHEMLAQAESALTRACSAEPDHGLGPVEVAHVDLG